MLVSDCFVCTVKKRYGEDLNQPKCRIQRECFDNDGYTYGPQKNFQEMSGEECHIHSKQTKMRHSNSRMQDNEEVILRKAKMLAIKYVLSHGRWGPRFQFRFIFYCVSPKSMIVCAYVNRVGEKVDTIRDPFDENLPHPILAAFCSVDQNLPTTEITVGKNYLTKTKREQKELFDFETMKDKRQFIELVATELHLEHLDSDTLMKNIRIGKYAVKF